MKVDINQVCDVVKWLEEVNSTHFSDIEWVDGENKVNVSDMFAENFSDTGLKNIDFAILKLSKKI